MSTLSVQTFKKALTTAQHLPFCELKNRGFRLVYNEKKEPVIFFGTSSVVFKITDGDRFYALKCFTTELFDRWGYLKNVQTMLQSLQKGWITPFELYENELYIENSEQQQQFYPIVLMPWIEGERLSDLVRLYCSGKSLHGNLKNLSESLITLANKHLGHPFSHGDISPENIIVTPSGKMMLIDHDSFTFEGWNSTAGQGGWSYPYQHPSRNPRKPDLDADHFSFLVLATSLKALDLNPALFRQYNSSRGLLFTIDDYRYPERSNLIKEMENIDDPYLLRLLKLLLDQLNKKSTSIPGLLNYLDTSDQEQTNPIAGWAAFESGTNQEKQNYNFYPAPAQTAPPVISELKTGKENNFQEEGLQVEEWNKKELQNAESERQNLLKEARRQEALRILAQQNEELRIAESEMKGLLKEASLPEVLLIAEQQKGGLRKTETEREEQQEEEFPETWPSKKKLIPEHEKQRKKIRAGVSAALAAVLFVMLGIKLFFPGTKLVSPVNYKEPSSTPGKNNAAATIELIHNEAVTATDKTDKTVKADSVTYDRVETLKPGNDNSGKPPVILSVQPVRKTVQKTLPARKPKYQKMDFRIGPVPKK